ncbi:hypothetical protein CRM22_001741, partial [Opisthorchis felineus]
SPGASVTTFSIIPCHSLPCVLTKGHEFTVLFTFTATKPISAGMAKVHAAFDTGFGPFSFPNSEVCKCLTPGCPITLGRFYTYSYTGTVPGEFRAGNAIIQWQLLNTEGDSFLCIQFKVKVE